MQRRLAAEGSSFSELLYGVRMNMARTFVENSRRPLAEVADLLGFASLSAFYHLAAGVRHLIWDTGAGLKPKSADFAVNLSIWFALIATALYWAWIILGGKVSL